jgi:hypothetical protein
MAAESMPNEWKPSKFYIKLGDIYVGKQRISERLN